MHATKDVQPGSSTRAQQRRRKRDRGSLQAAESQAAVKLTSRRLSRRRIDIKLSIIMAAYNEQETLEQAIDELLSVEYPCDMELIVVDDGSMDKTPELLAQVSDSRVVVLRHLSNQGKGAALLTGLMRATGSYILPFDADLEYLPDDIIKLLEPVLMGRCSVVYGVRLFGYNTVYRSYVYALGNRILTRTANIMFGSCLSDLHTCLKLIPTSVLRSLALTERGFGLDTEVSAWLLRHGVRPFEVPVSYFSRSHEEGKKINWRDALGCLWILIRVRFQPRRRLGVADGAAAAGQQPDLREGFGAPACQAGDCS
jgi:glycosyltransferase involved in cell wall biosynthesis